MPKDYAGLLAQVVPVMAIAIGLEIRSRVPHLRRAIKKIKRVENSSFSRERSIIIVLTFVAYLLAVVEIKALNTVSSTSATTTAQLLVDAGVLIAFLAPAYDGVRIATFYEGSPMTRNRFAAMSALSRIFYLSNLTISLLLAVGFGVFFVAASPG